MIMLSGVDKIDFQQYDMVWYVTTTCPNMCVGCEHHPELAASKNLYKYCYGDNKDLNKFYEEYCKELTSEPKLSNLKKLVEMSNRGMWVQLIFYEKDMHDGERLYMYNILKKLTANVYVE